MLPHLKGHNVYTTPWMPQNVKRLYKVLRPEGWNHRSDLNQVVNESNYTGYWRRTGSFVRATRHLEQTDFYHQVNLFFRVYSPAFSLPEASPVLAKALKRPIIVHFKAFSCNRGDSGIQGPLLLQPHPSGRSADMKGDAFPTIWTQTHTIQFTIKKNTHIQKVSFPSNNRNVDKSDYFY